MRTLLVTSTQPLEGKSTVVLNLGIAAAGFGRWRVLFVDGDLRRPMLSERFGRLGDVGLADLLQGRATADVIQRAGKLEADTNLSLMPAGRGGAGFVATLDRERARSTVRDAGAGFDITLIGTPPVLAVKDAATLAGAAEGVLLIVGAGEVNDRSAALAKERARAERHTARRRGAEPLRAVGAWLGQPPLSGLLDCRARAVHQRRPRPVVQERGRLSGSGSVRVFGMCLQDSVAWSLDSRAPAGRT